MCQMICEYFTAFEGPGVTVGARQNSGIEFRSIQYEYSAVPSVSPFKIQAMFFSCCVGDRIETTNYGHMAY